MLYRIIIAAILRVVNKLLVFLAHLVLSSASLIPDAPNLSLSLNSFPFSILYLILPHSTPQIVALIDGLLFVYFLLSVVRWVTK